METKFKVDDWVDFVGFFAGSKPQQITKIKNKLIKGEPLVVYYLSIGFEGMDIQYLSEVSLKLWQPKPKDWIIPKFETFEDTLTAYKVNEVVSYKNERTNIVVCTNGNTLKLIDVKPFFFNI